jgi:hypothetical protein
MLLAYSCSKKSLSLTSTKGYWQKKSTTRHIKTLGWSTATIVISMAWLPRPNPKPHFPAWRHKGGRGEGNKRGECVDDEEEEERIINASWRRRWLDMARGVRGGGGDRDEVSEPIYLKK